MPSHFEYPDFIARFYDVIYDHIRTGIDNHFYLDRIKKAKGSVLEVGVGTGRFFMDALNNGADMYGIDISNSMIERLKEKLDIKNHHRIQAEDILNLHTDKKFDLVIAPFRMFSHLVEIDQQINALNKVWEDLNDGGTFIFDLFVPDLNMIQNGITNLTDFQGEYEPGKKLKRITNMKADLINQVSHVNFKLVWDEDGKEISRDWDFEMRFFFHWEIEHLVARSKLRLEKIFGDFYENDLTSDSSDFIVVCRK